MASKQTVYNRRWKAKNAERVRQANQRGHYRRKLRHCGLLGKAPFAGFRTDLVQGDV